MDLIENKAYDAHIAAAILALGIQNISSLNQDDIDRVYDLALDSLLRTGINIEFSEVKDINKMSIEDAQSFVVKLKAKIIALLYGACDPLVSHLFELSFNLYLVSTTPEEVPNLRGYLLQLAAEAGFSAKTFTNVLDSLEAKAERGLSEYEKAVTNLLKKADDDSFFSLFEAKPGMGGFSFDIKEALQRIVRWRNR